MPKDRRTFGLSWSWRRASGLSGAKGRVSRAIGVPLTRQGRQRKLGRMAEVGCIVLAGLLLVACLGLVLRACA